MLLKPQRFELVRLTLRRIICLSKVCDFWGENRHFRGPSFGLHALLSQRITLIWLFLGNL